MIASKSVADEQLAVGQLCACDMANLGDLLYPIVFQRMAIRHGFAGEITPLGFMAGDAPCGAGYRVKNTGSFLKRANARRTSLVVGGGDVIRTDVERVSGHYDGADDPALGAGFWARLGRIFAGGKMPSVEHNKSLARAGFSWPFILNKRSRAQARSVLYCSCGVPFEFTVEERGEIREAFEAAAFVYVRDAQSREKLRATGVGCEIAVAPDLIVTASDFFEPAAERAKGLAILARHDVKVGGNIVCFQACPQALETDEELIRQLLVIKRQNAAEIVLLPIGLCHGDDAYLKRLADKSHGEFSHIRAGSIHEMISILAACELFAGTSMHGNIIAFSFGIPHLFGPIHADKVQGFLAVAGLPADFQIQSWAQMSDKAAAILKLPKTFFPEKALLAKQQVHQTFARLVQALQRPVG